ncbi:hypothetical protein Tco_1404911 [Tanacetum coccineum]
MGLEAILIAERLSQNTLTGRRLEYFKSFKILRIQITSEVTEARALYSAFVEDFEIIVLGLGNLKFVSKGEADEVFGMPIPNEMISNNIQNAPYYSAYLEMVAKHDQKVAAKKEGKKKTTSSKQPKPNRAIEKLSKLAPAPKLKLVDEPDEEPAHSEPETEPKHQGEGEDFDMARAIQMSLELFQAQGHAHVRGVAIQEPVAEATRPLPIVEGKGKAIVTKEQAEHSILSLHTPKRRSTTDQFIFKRRTPATEEASTGPSAQLLDDTYGNIVRDSSSLADAKKGARSDKTSSGGDTEVLKFTEELGEDMEKQENVEEKTVELDEDLDQTLRKHMGLNLHQSRHTWMKTTLNQTLE